MVLTALVLFCCNTISVDTPRTPAAPLASQTKVEATADRVAGAEVARPDAPTPKTTTASSSSKTDLGSGSGGAASMTAIEPALTMPMKPAVTESYETPRERKIWYGLIILAHGTAAFDAWTTRRALRGGYGVEGDPMQRPFANSGAIYATTQVTPVIMDFVALRMMRSSHPWVRKAWWVPQAASASVSLGAGIHNYSVVP